MMKKSFWQKVLYFQIIDNDTFQAWNNKVFHFASTWLLFPFGSVCMLFLSSFWIFWPTKHTFWGAIFFGPCMVLVALFAGYPYYFPRGMRKYFYVVFAIPAVIAFFSLIACLATALLTGSWHSYM